MGTAADSKEENLGRIKDGDGSCRWARRYMQQRGRFFSSLQAAGEKDYKNVKLEMAGELLI